MRPRAGGLIGIAVCASLMFCASARAGDVFEGLGPQTIGTELTAVLEEAELACRRDPADADIRRCHPIPGALDTLAGAPAVVEAQFAADHLALVSITFPEARFADVRRFANEQLGAGKDWSVGIIAGMNGTFKAEITIWESEDRAAVLQQFDRKINRSSLIYGTPSAMAPLLRRIKATPPGGMRDL